MPFSHDQFRRAILHIDGDAFFASCEQSRDPKLQGRPVITGKERGIASSLSYEAKARGVTRGMALFEIKKICPDVVIMPSDYETYSLLSKRFYEIVRRFTSEVEEYGIDECFADITGLRRLYKMSYEKIAERIQNDLKSELGFTFSIGLAPNKVLAKVGSKWKKPYGLTVISGSRAEEYLKRLDVGKIWGIGPQTTAYLYKFGIKTANDFARREEFWVNQNLTKPHQEIWQELNSKFVLPLNLEQKESYQSVQKVKTFTPPSNNKVFVFGQLSKNIENACIKLRRYKQASREGIFFLRKQDFRHRSMRIKFSRETAIPSKIIKIVRDKFDEIWKDGELYRSTGVTLFNLVTSERLQLDLFGENIEIDRMSRIYEQIDSINKHCGKHKVYLASSFSAHNFDQHLGSRGDNPARMKDLFLGETKRRRIGIPMLFT